VFARSRTRGIRPITIGRQLVDTIDDIATSDTNIPAAYVVRVNPTDLALLEPVRKPLVNELRQAVTNHARFEGYTLASEPTVTLVGAEDVPAGGCVVEAAAGHTAQPPTVAIPTVAPIESWHLVGESGLRFDVVGDRVTIGRQSTCGVHIPDTNVSRVHAELRQTPTGWVVEDRGSTNGTKVNDTQIVEPTAVQSGDTLSFGSVTLTFVRG
jgi:hypothetical protein